MTEILSFIIAVIALVIAVVAFVRTGGVSELKHQVEALNSTTDSVRDRTADALNRLASPVRTFPRRAGERAGSSRARSRGGGAGPTGF